MNQKRFPGFVPFCGGGLAVVMLHKALWDDIATRGLKNISIVNTEALPAFEDTVNDWETNFHIPWLMEYDGIGNVVRYQRVDGMGTDMPKFIEFFYYYDQAGADGLGSNESFKAAEADRVATWKNGELEIPWIVNGVIFNGQISDPAATD